jgi:hypothetical protein
MYQKNWEVSVVEAGIQINFYPYCGGNLTRLFSESEENSS